MFKITDAVMTPAIYQHHVRLALKVAIAHWVNNMYEPNKEERDTIQMWKQILREMESEDR